MARDLPQRAMVAKTYVAQVSTPQWRTAVSRQPINISMSTGLPRTAIAPPFIAAVFVRSSLYDVTKIMGGRSPSLLSSSCSSIPLRPGILTSTIMQSISERGLNFRNSSADEKRRHSKPHDLTRSSIASRIAWSSSTTAMVGTRGKGLTFSISYYSALICAGQLPDDTILRYRWLKRSRYNFSFLDEIDH